MTSGKKAALAVSVFVLLGLAVAAYLVVAAGHEKLRPKDVQVHLYVVEADNHVVRLPMTDLIVVKSDIFESNYSSSHPPVAHEIELASSLVRDSIARIAAASSAFEDAKRNAEDLRAASVTATVAIDAYAKSILEVELSQDFDMLCRRLVAQGEFLRRRVSRAVSEAEAVPAYNNRASLSLRAEVVTKLRSITFPSHDELASKLRATHDGWVAQVLHARGRQSPEELMRHRMEMESAVRAGIINVLAPALSAGDASAVYSYLGYSGYNSARDSTAEGLRKVTLALAKDLGISNASRYGKERVELSPDSPLLNIPDDHEAGPRRLATGSAERRARHLATLSRLVAAKVITPSVSEALQVAYDTSLPASSLAGAFGYDNGVPSATYRSLRLAEKIFDLNTSIVDAKPAAAMVRQAAESARSEITLTRSVLASGLPSSTARLAGVLYFPAESRTAEAKTDVNGQCLFSLPDGNYYLCANSPIYGYWSVPLVVRADTRLELNNSNIRIETVPVGRSLLNVSRSSITDKLPERFSYMVAISGISSLPAISSIFQQLRLYETEADRLAQIVADK